MKVQIEKGNKSPNRKGKFQIKLGKSRLVEKMKKKSHSYDHDVKSRSKR